jgi:hypothetical protein
MKADFVIAGLPLGEQGGAITIRDLRVGGGLLESPGPRGGLEIA